jgi:hypothetical protein
MERLLKACGDANQQDLARQLRFFATRKRSRNTALNLTIAVRTFDKLAGGKRLAELEDVDEWSRLVSEYASGRAAATIRGTVAYLKAFLTRVRGEPLPRRLNELLSIRDGREAREVAEVHDLARQVLARARHATLSLGFFDVRAEAAEPRALVRVAGFGERAVELARGHLVERCLVLARPL